ncbi:cytochrome P450 [Mycena maculata]|uniref:Cytochrome P450 n=1 Tax=Mycena maculata TaxID=230809 RepID=A0AAD7ND10_9AGAR|nr:cytochrome P450 [Mycena maculata]
MVEVDRPHPRKIRPAELILVVKQCTCGSVLPLLFTMLSVGVVRHPLPPGPKPLPLIGNLLDMPRSKSQQTFSKWTDLYGDVVYLNVFGRHIILLNSVKSTNDLLEKRGQNYSDRPQFPLINLVGHGWNFGFKPYGKEWQSLRRTFTSQYNSNVTLRSFYEAHRDSASTFLVNIFREPEGISNHLRIRSAQIILEVTYGISVKSSDDPVLRNAEAVMDVVSTALSPGMWIINPISILRFIPQWLGGGLVAAQVRRWQADLEDLRHVPFNVVKNSMAHGIAKPCFTANLLQESAVVDETLIRDTAAIALGAAYETSFVAGEVFILAMVLNEWVQHSAQTEIDSVVGSDRLPDFIDRERLPFITAIVKEVLRWHPPAPTGIPHRLTQDDIYEGMFLPAGSMVMGNIWQILHDPLMYPDPSKFDPNRYIVDGKLDCSNNDPSRYAFGFGRRACPGRLFTEDSLWLMIAQFLAVYSVLPSADGPLPEAAFTSGAISRPVPFKHVILPRSTAARKLLAELIQADD